MTPLFAALMTAGACVLAGGWLAWLFRRSAMNERDAALRQAAGRHAATDLVLSRDRRQMASVLENMVEGVVAVDAEGRILLVNPALAIQFLTDMRMAAGRPYLEVIRSVQLSRVLTEVLQKKVPVIEEIAVVSPAVRYFEAHAVPLAQEGAPSGALVVLHDITRLRALEQVRREFVANVSHELKTPLTSIKGFAEALRTGGIDDAANRLEFVETIERHADQLALLVDDLLDLAAIESGNKPPALLPLSIKEAAADALSAIQPLAGSKGVSVSLDPSLDGLPKALADRGQLRQVLVNLLNNAVKFNRAQGTVEILGTASGKLITVSVRDQGAGIPEPDLPRIFERFYRVDKARSRELGGTGLGLSIVKHIVESHGGSVGVESAEGKGSTFHFTLPTA